jgi:hypothetical protein
MCSNWMILYETWVGFWLNWKVNLIWNCSQFNSNSVQQDWIELNIDDGVEDLLVNVQKNESTIWKDTISCLFTWKQTK